MSLRPAVAGACVWAILAAAGMAVAQTPGPVSPTPAKSEVLIFGAEWRFVRAGEVEVRTQHGVQTDMRLKTLGLVDSLFRVNNVYRAEYGAQGCVKATLLEAHEGKKHTETRVTYDYEKRRAYYLERDLLKDAVMNRSDIEVPACIQDLTGALGALRRSPMTGQPFTLGLSDGKKAIQARVEHLGKEQLTTAMGTFTAHKLEAFLFNGVFFRRKGRLFVWVSDDERRLPVRMRVQLPFYIGTVTIDLEKAERN
jgi:hypothetical protein